MSKKVKKENIENVDGFKAKAKELFATHTCTEFYFTSDGTAFTEMQHARVHAGFLKDAEITTIKKEEIE